MDLDYNTCMNDCVQQNLEGKDSLQRTEDYCANVCSSKEPIEPTSEPTKLDRSGMIKLFK
eukprot:NODE_11203_length_312_cov_49.387833_g10290_i0.p1 GENE.NODE_11203_length_312_cov_49.387833_g10290_i0~~NODE_11203_length_312_cov_49.387833_g10290_i0.p1  ORF type:complete len:60 (+),score=5.52 NODE_11203_length_312_cov_49.387833_g10290_i0:75-254(+)